EGMPPLRAFASHLVELEHAVGLAPARVVRHAPPGYERPGALVHDAARFVLVHAEEQEVPDEVARLRRAAHDLRLDRAGDRVGGAEIVLGLVAEERADIAERRGAGAEHVWVLDGVAELIKLGRVEAVLHAHIYRQCGHRHWGRERAAAAEFPVAVRDGLPER